MCPARSAELASRFGALLARPGAAALLAVLGRDGEEARIVGGAVRDALIGRSVDDIDIATTMRPEAVMAAAEREGWKAVPTGIAHGTATIVIRGVPHEVTTLRRDVETDGRRAVVAFTRDFREDAARRDFTMNALSVSPDGAVHDYADGVADAHAGLVRFMGDPETRIREDYLRILRFFRFHASHGRGAPDAAALSACAALKGGMRGLSRERVRQELLKLLSAPGAVAAADAMEAIGLWPLILPDGAPDLAALRALAALEAALSRPSDPILRLAALDGGAAGLRTSLKLSNDERDRLAAAKAGASEPADSPAAMRSLAFRLGPEALRDAILLGAAWNGREADATATQLALAEAEIASLPANPFRSADVAAMGVPPGPRMGAILNAATRAWLAAGLPTDDSRQAAILRQAHAETIGDAIGRAPD